MKACREITKVVLALTKNSCHRVYPGQGIFGEVTMHFRNGSWEFLHWTSANGQSQEYLMFFLALRRIYRAALKTMCMLKGQNLEKSG